MASQHRTARRLALSTVTLALASAVAACGSASDATPGTDEAAVTQGAPKLCAAIKGNGPRILAQITSLARITEEFGEIDAMAGGSSGTISTFLYESMLLNPVLGTCGNRPCDAQEKAARLALLLKTVHGYGEIVAQETGLAKLAGTIGSFRMSAKPTSEELATAVGALRLAVNANVQAILNTNEILGMLREPNATKRAFNVSEIRTAFEQFGNFQVPDNRILFRVPIINWDAATRVFGRAGDFYAGEGYGPFDSAGTAAFLDACAAPSKGKTWEDLKTLSVGGGGIGDKTCADRFAGLLLRHRETIASRGGASGDRHRINENVGGKLRAIAHSTAIRGEAAASYEASLASYKAGNLPGTGDVASFTPKFDDLVYGYWSSSQDAEVLRAMPNGGRFSDLKSKKLVAFGPRTWEYVLSRSPAEPGIARLRPNDDAQAKYTSGGWGDGLPTQVLRQIGCETVVLVTRRDHGTGNFARSVAAEFGASPAEVSDLYDQTTTTGVMSQSLRGADGVWCTDWDAPSNTDVAGLSREGYSAPLLSSSARFSGYANLRAPSSASIAGCSPGVAATD